MCKIIALTDTKKLNLRKSINSIGQSLLRLEKDGFGYAVQGSKGIFGEKTIARSFSTRLWSNNTVKLPIVKEANMAFGSLGTLTGPGVFHGRTSTNVKGLLNCHPMQRDGWHLIHNGVVDDNGPKYDKTTQNDSEDVLRRLMDGIEHVEAQLEGYYAFAAIDPSGRLHVCRDNTATLFIAKSEVLETYIIATTESLLRSVNKTLKAKIGPIDEIKENWYGIFEGNELIHQQTIKPLGFTRRQSTYAEQSLGRTIDTGHHSHGVIDMTVDEGWGAFRERNTTQDGREGFTDEEEHAYYDFKHELEEMDASYTIIGEGGIDVTVAEFRKMDYISQELCTIIRPDGTVVDIESHMLNGNLRLA